MNSASFTAMRALLAIFAMLASSNALTTPVNYDITFTQTWLKHDPTIPGYEWLGPRLPLTGQISIDDSVLGPAHADAIYGPNAPELAAIYSYTVTLDSKVYLFDQANTASAVSPPFTSVIRLDSMGTIVDLQGRFKLPGTISEIMLGRDGWEGTYRDIQQSGPFSSVVVSSGTYSISIQPPKCAILGQELVKIGAGSSLAVGASNLCSNGNLQTAAKVRVDTSLLALGDMKLGAGTEVGQDAFTNGSLRTGAKVSIGFGDDLGDLDVDTGGDLSLGSGTQVEGECQYAGTLHTATTAACGTETQEATLPLPDPFVLPECTVTPPAAGAPAIKTRHGSEEYFNYPLQPGDYGTVGFGSNNKVALEAGEYHFQSLKFGPKTEVEIRGPITVHVVDALHFTNGVREVLVGVLPSEILYLVDGATAADSEHRGGARTVLFGTFCGPDSTISIGNRSELTGAIIGKEVRLGASVDFTAAPAPVQ